MWGRPGSQLTPSDVGQSDILPADGPWTSDETELTKMTLALFVTLCAMREPQFHHTILDVRLTATAVFQRGQHLKQETVSP